MADAGSEIVRLTMLHSDAGTSKPLSPGPGLADGTPFRSSTVNDDREPNRAAVEQADRFAKSVVNGRDRAALLAAWSF